jgi:hypothetical protein
MRAVNIAAVLFAGAVLGFGSAHAIAGQLSSGDLVVLQSGDGGTLNSNAPFSILELTKAAGQASALQNFDISGSASPMWTSSSATSTGYLSLSQDRSSVQWAAHTTRATIGANENTITARGVGSLNAAGTYSQIATYTGGSGNQARSAGLMTSGDLFIGDQGGLYTTGGTSAATSANIRNIRSFGGTAYAFQASASIPAVSAISGTPSSPTLTGVPGLGALGTSIQDFYMVSSASNSTFDLLYVATSTGINKYQFTGGSWTARGTTAISGGFFGLAAELDATGGVDLYVTTGSGAANANSVKRFIDSSAAGASISLDGGTTL